MSNEIRDRETENDKRKKENIHLQADSPLKTSMPRVTAPINTRSCSLTVWQLQKKDSHK